jgi:hypothetical protein|tara:strand:+ start:2204 stop:2467 length:264 start_codon:yes stop_codon:yes gene_type:complete
VAISRAQTAKQVKNAPSSKKVKKVMGEFKRGTLKSGGSGKKVTNPKQAVAIALSEAGVEKKSGGGKIPKPKCRNGIAIRGRTRGRTV